MDSRPVTLHKQPNGNIPSPADQYESNPSCSEHVSNMPITSYINELLKSTYDYENDELDEEDVDVLMGNVELAAIIEATTCKIMKGTNSVTAAQDLTGENQLDVLADVDNNDVTLAQELDIENVMKFFCFFKIYPSYF